MRAFIVVYVFSGSWRAEPATRSPPGCTAGSGGRCKRKDLSEFHFEREHGEDQRHYLSQ
jgi:hypothetical protein